MNDIEKALISCKNSLEKWENDIAMDERTIARNKRNIANERTKIKALEKQIPKKITSTLSCKNVCPTCECAVRKALRTDKHCQTCGQAIDWGE